jgi:hypothetical protein
LTVPLALSMSVVCATAIYWLPNVFLMMYRPLDSEA